MTELHAGADAELRFLAHEHAELRPGIERIETAAEMVGRTSREDLADQVRKILDWMASSLDPHAAWEEGWLYPELDKLGGSPWTTRTMRFDHALIRDYVNVLEHDWDAVRRHLQPETLRDLRAHLYGLHGLLHAHLEKERVFLEPLLAERG